jgi:hypothetical protein
MARPVFFFAALLLLLCSCAERHTERREFIPGQAFSADERAWRSTHDSGREAYRPPAKAGSSRGKAPEHFRPAVQYEEFTPARLEHFRGNPRLVK